MKFLNRSLFKLFKLIALMIVILISSCGEDEEVIPVVLNLGPDQNVSNGDLVTISLSNSSGPAGTMFTLEYQNGPVDPDGAGTIIEDLEGNQYSDLENVLTTDDTSETFSFIAKANGQYFFKLRSGFAADELIVTVSGPIVITNENLLDHLTLNDQNGSGNSSVSDYLIAEVLNVTNQTWTISSDVQVEVAEGAGIILDNSYMESVSLSTSIYGDSWKGIVVKNGAEVKYEFLSISNTGTDFIEGYDPALITVENGTVGVRNCTLESEETGIILYADAVINPSCIISGNLFNVENALHCNVFQSELVVGNSTNLAKATATIQGAGDTFIATGDGDYSLNIGELDIYFKGGVTMSDFSIIQLQGGNDILFEEGTGLVLSQGGRILSAGGTSTLKGLNDANWDGVLISGTIGSWMQNIEVKGAGSEAHTLSGSIASSVYVTGRLDLVENVTVSDGSSFGFYFTANADIQANNNSLEDIRFSGMADAAISGPADVVSDFLLGTNYDFGSDETEAAVKVRSPVSGTGEIIFDPLGGSHFYLIEDNLNFIGTGSRLFIRSGAFLKFDNTSIYVGSGTTGQITIEGTSTDPVTLTAADANVGWGGIYFGSSSVITYSIDYANISHAGNVLHTGASEQASLVWNSTANITCTNSTFSSSKGWGVVLESFADFYDFGSVGNSNSFSGNTSGNINDKTN